MSRKIIVFFSFTVLFNTLSFAQVTNDDCFGAVDLGTLPVPASCPNGAGTPQDFNLNNNGAIAGNPYSLIINCQSGSDMAAPAADVWFSFIASAYELDVTVTGGLTNPSIGFYEGSCGSLIPRGCNTGNTTATFTPITPGQTYYLQISGQNLLDQGNFTLTLNNYTDCSLCLSSSSLVVSPAPVNGTYQPGQTVNFCYTVDSFTQGSNNWFEAIVPIFGSGWDMSTLTPGATPVTIGPPPPNPLPWPNGTWIWTNNVTSSATGLFIPDWGWFFDFDNDGDPGNDYGDSYVDGAGVVVGSWTFCWSIITNSCPPGTEGDDLSVQIDNYADGEAGSWVSPACQLDPSYLFSATLTCCPSPIMSQTNILCFGGNGSATADGQGTGPWDYVWEDAVGTVIQTANNVGGSNTITGLSAGSYIVTVTDDNGCSKVATVTITEPSVIILTFTSTPTSCGGSDGTATVSASGGMGSYTYAWSPIGGTDSAASNLPAGTYSVIVTDLNGCTQTDSIVVANTGGVVASITSFTNVSCFGGSDGTATVSVTGGTAPYTYLWSPSGGVGATGTGLSDNTYIITVTDSNGCTDSDTISITEPTPLIATGNSSPSTCGNANGVATVSPLGGTLPYTYEWQDNLGNPIGQTNDTATSLFADTFMVVITDANNCTLTFPVTVTDVAGPVIDSITTTDVTCNGEPTGSATVSISSGILPFTYLWDDSLAQTIITPLNSFTATDLVAGLVSVTITDLNGCVVTGSVTVTEPDSLIVNTFGADICDGGSSQISATVSGGTGANNYSWDNGLPDSTTHIVSPIITTTYTVLVTDENGCQDSSAITVIVFSPLTVSDSNAEICEGESVVLSATPSGGNGGPYYYTWSDGSTGSPITVSPLSTITYTVIVSDSCSADDTAIVNVIVNPLPSANFDAACFPDPFITQFTNNSSPISGSAFLWDFGDGNSSTEQNPSHVFSGSGDYTVTLTVTTGKGCSNDTSITIQAPPTAEFILTPNETTTANPEINFTDLSNTFSNVAFWEWDFGDSYGIDNLSGQAGSDSIPLDDNLITGTYQDPTHSYNDAGTYYILLTVYNAAGCRDTAMQFLNVFSEYFLFAPSAFTPNRDKINDVFLPQGIGINEGDFEMFIFNRWGDLIYETDDFNKGWDGKANRGIVFTQGRKIAQAGVYIWLINTKDPRGSRHHYTGHVTLIR